MFERKWQGLPRFQQTRGVLRLLALWVSKAYADGYKGAHKDPLISLGTAPLEDALFRAALFEQLGEARLEPAVTTDIAGKEHAHALRLDTEANPEVKKARLHRKVATSILFESNGGQQRGEASLAEVRLDVAEPGLDIGSVEQCVEALGDACYFLSAERNRYRFSFQPNLNKLLADRRASVGTPVVAVERFAPGWLNVSLLRALPDPCIAASFDGEAAEDFEEQWSNDLFLWDYVDGDLTAALFLGEPVDAFDAGWADAFVWEWEDLAAAPLPLTPTAEGFVAWPLMETL